MLLSLHASFANRSFFFANELYTSYRLFTFNFLCLDMCIIFRNKIVYEVGYFIATKLSSNCRVGNFLITIFVVNIQCRLTVLQKYFKTKIFVQALSRVCIDEGLLFGMMPNLSYLLTVVVVSTKS